MLTYIIALLVFVAFVCCIYYTPILIKKIFDILNKSAWSYFVKICIIVAFAGGVMYSSHLFSQNNVNLERLICDKTTDICIYSIAKYGNNEFQEQSRFPISPIKSIVLQQYKVEHLGRFGNNYTTTHYVIKLSEDYVTYFDYPIHFDNRNTAQKASDNFESFLHNEDHEYRDFADHHVEEMLIFLFIAAALVLFIALYEDFCKWQKTRKKDANE
ncbi:MAG: hypothetical protein IKR92_04770 [Alphaproteobacteria bacterium]|nr:hypothetical protein [Alphaproteobacteria bacterium]